MNFIWDAMNIVRNQLYSDVQYMLGGEVSLGTRPLHAKEEEGLVKLHT